MTNLVEKLRLAEQAAEDIYFAKIDRELIAALHRPPRIPKNHPGEASRRLDARAGETGVASNDSGDRQE